MQNAMEKIIENGWDLIFCSKPQFEEKYNLLSWIWDVAENGGFFKRNALLT